MILQAPFNPISTDSLVPGEGRLYSSRRREEAISRMDIVVCADSVGTNVATGRYWSGHSDVNQRKIYRQCNVHVRIVHPASITYISGIM